MAGILEKYRDLLEKPTFAHIATIGPSGAPHVTPVWIDYDGRHVLFNTARGRLKERHIARDPRVAFSILDPENPYRYVEVRGRAAELTEQGADAHIDKLAKKYLGKDRYPFRKAGEVRVIVKIVPEQVSGM
jgi:PPOX class probable F420-dependent enzyme